MKKQLFSLKSLLLLLIISIAFTGATFAFFTSSVSNTGNRIQAGNLKVALEASDSLDGTYRDISGLADPVFDYGDKAKPGDQAITSYIKVTNNGNIPMDYKIEFNVSDEGLAGAVSFEIEKVVFIGDTNDYTLQTVDGLGLKTEELKGYSLTENDFEIYKITMSFDANNSYNLDVDDANFPLAFEFDIKLFGWQDNASDQE